MKKCLICGKYYLRRHTCDPEWYAVDAADLKMADLKNLDKLVEIGYAQIVRSRSARLAAQEAMAREYYDEDEIQVYVRPKSGCEWSRFVVTRSMEPIYTAERVGDLFDTNALPVGAFRGCPEELEFYQIVYVRSNDPEDDSLVYRVQLDHMPTDRCPTGGGSLFTRNGELTDHVLLFGRDQIVAYEPMDLRPDCPLCGSSKVRYSSVSLVSFFCIDCQKHFEILPI